jgi:hypothetical protein
MGMYSSIVSLRQAMGDYAPAEDGTWKDAVVKYGKGNNFRNTDSNSSDTENREVVNQDKEIYVNVQGTNVQIDKAMEWLKDGRQARGQEEANTIKMPLTRKMPNGSYEPIDLNGNKEVTYEDALEWLEK